MDFKKPRKTRRANLRLTDEQANRIQGLADMYANGNINLWITWGAINAPRRYIKREDIEAKRKKARRRK